MAIVKPLLEIDKVSLSFAGVRALDGVSLAVGRGELIAVIGPNGAGKTSLFNCISGVYRPQAGRIRLDGQVITELSPHRVAALGVARMFQNLALFENLTVLDNLLVGRHHLYKSGLVGNLLWLGPTRREEIAHRRRIEDIIDFLHLERYRSIPVQILPYGVRKRVELGRALAMEPRLLLLDEPTAGLNQEETEDMARYILDISAELGVTQILIEHELRFVLDLAERVAVLDFGRLIAEGEPREIRQDPAVIEAYIGTEHASMEARRAAEAAAESGSAVESGSESGSDSEAAVGSNSGSAVESGSGSASGPAAESATGSGHPYRKAASREAPSPAALDDAALETTLPGLLALHARVRPERVAVRDKSLGLWQEVSWLEYYQTVRACARMLWHLGVGPGDHVAIISDNRPEWLYADLAAQCLGARSVGIYQTNPPEDVAYILQDSGSIVLFCEDQEQVDKAVAIAAEVPQVRRVVVFDPRGTRDLSDARLLPWADFLAQGRELLAEDKGDGPPASASDWLSGHLGGLDPKKPSMVVYTSGTTGPPKGAMISSHNVIAISGAFNRALGMSERDFVLSYLPLCHVAEKIFSIFFPLTAGAAVHFGESIDTVQADLREVSPTVFLGVPRIWEKMHATITVKMQDSSFLKRTLFRYFLRAGRAIVARRRAGYASVLARARDWLLWRIGDLTVYRPLQERLGLRRCRLPVTGAAPLGTEILHFFHGIGITLLEGYGQTESAGVSHINPQDAPRVGTVGQSLPLLECRLADDGEILLRGPNVFCGYLNRPEATADTIDPDGWLHTGDIGSVDDDGYLSITGRKKEIIITSGGKNLSPEKIENALKASPYIKESVAIGDARKFVSALVQIEYESVGDWATRRQLPYTSYTDLAGKPAVIDLVSAEIDKANDRLARVEQVRSFRILPKELNQDDGELTATQKVRRRAIHAAYAELIESMYRRPSPGSAGPAEPADPAGSGNVEEAAS